MGALRHSFGHLVDLVEDLLIVQVVVVAVSANPEEDRVLVLWCIAHNERLQFLINDHIGVACSKARYSFWLVAYVTELFVAEEPNRHAIVFYLGAQILQGLGTHLYKY